MAMPARQLVPVRGAMFGAALEVDEAIEAAAVSPLLRHVLNKAKREAFSTAGFQQRGAGQPAAEPGLWCEFDLAGWARELAHFGITRKYLWRLREQAEALGFFTYHPDPDDPGRGYLRWSLDFSTWTALDPEYRRRRYHREGAGRKPAGQSNVIRSAASENKSNVAESESNVIRLSAKRRIKRDTPGGLEGPGQAAPAAPVRIRKETETPHSLKARARAREDEIGDETREPEAGAMDAAGPSYESMPAPARPARVETGLVTPAVNAKQRAEIERVVAALRLADDWKPSAKDAQIVRQLAEGGKSLDWLHDQALRYATTEQDREGRPTRHNTRGFVRWCTNAPAQRFAAEWEQTQREIHAARDAQRAPSKPEGTEHGNAARPKSTRPAAAAAAAPPSTSQSGARPRVSTGLRTDRRPLWEDD